MITDSTRKAFRSCYGRVVASVKSSHEAVQLKFSDGSTLDIKALVSPGTIERAVLPLNDAECLVGRKLVRAEFRLHYQEIQNNPPKYEELYRMELRGAEKRIPGHLAKEGAPIVIAEFEIVNRHNGRSRGLNLWARKVDAKHGKKL